MSSASAESLTVKLNELRFDNRHARSLPVDPQEKNFCRQVPNSVFSYVNPTPVKNPKLVAWSEDALALIGINTKEVDESELTKYLSGNTIFPGTKPMAHCYCGHQFGSFAGQVGLCLSGEMVCSLLTFVLLHS
jgi:uncharacterized protein YdiU (UPF0061 family)